MTKLELNELQRALLEHMRTFPSNMSRDLVEATVDREVILNSGDITLKRKPTEDLFYDNIRSHGFGGPNVIFLFTPSVQFAYDPATGREIGNTMDRYGITDRTKILPRLGVSLARDSITYLRVKGLNSQFQDELVDLIIQD